MDNHWCSLWVVWVKLLRSLLSDWRMPFVVSCKLGWLAVDSVFVYFGVILFDFHCKIICIYIIYFKLRNLCVYVYVGVCILKCGCPQRPEEGSRTLELELTLKSGAGNSSWVLCCWPSPPACGTELLNPPASTLQMGAGIINSNRICLKTVTQTEFCNTAFSGSSSVLAFQLHRSAI